MLFESLIRLNLLLFVFRNDAKQAEKQNEPKSAGTQF